MRRQRLEVDLHRLQLDRLWRQSGTAAISTFYSRITELLGFTPNRHEGKLGVLCLSPEKGLGVQDQEKRERIGEDKITMFERHAAAARAAAAEG